MRASLKRTLITAGVLALILAGGVGLHQRSETLPPQSPAIALVEQELKREFRRGWLRVIQRDRLLELRVNGEAVLGYSNRAPRLEDVDTGVVRFMARRAIDLYAPPRFGPVAGIDTVRVRLRHAYMLGPVAYRTAGRDFNFTTAQLSR